MPAFPGQSYISGDRFAIDPLTGQQLRWGIPSGGTTPRWLLVGGGSVVAATGAVSGQLALGGTVDPLAASSVGVPEGTMVVQGDKLLIVQDGVPVTVGTITPATLPPPANFRTTAVTTTTVGLAWNAVSGSTAFDVLKDDAVIATITGTTHTVSGLSENTRYRMGVRAKGGAVVGPTSNLDVTTTNAAPPAPTITGTNPISATTVDVSFTVPAISDYSRVEGFVNGVYNAVATTSPIRLTGSGTFTAGIRTIDTAGTASPLTTTSVTLPIERIPTGATASSSVTERPPSMAVDGNTGTYWLSQQYATEGGADQWRGNVTGTIKAVRLWLSVQQAITVMLNESVVVAQGTFPGGGWLEWPCNVPNGSLLRVALIPVAIPGFSGIRSAIVEVRYVA